MYSDSVPSKIKQISSHASKASMHLAKCGANAVAICGAKRPHVISSTHAIISPAQLLFEPPFECHINRCAT